MENEPFKLSYSAETTALTCEQRYAYSHIMKLPIDPDANTDTASLRFGKAHHSILEKCEYEMGYFLDKADEYLEAACKEFKIDQHFTQCLLASCVYSSLKLWETTKLRVVKCEIQIGDEHTNGFVDFVAVCPNTRKWYIGDNKTASPFYTANPTRLPRDPQLSLYAKFRKQIADICGLNVEDFVGCLYMEVIKHRLSVEKEGKEKLMTYAKRCVAECNLYFVPKEMISEDPVAVHSYIYNRILELKAGRVPIRNYKHCTDFGRKCEYWSRCYGEFGSRVEEIMGQNTFSLYREGKGKAQTVQINSRSLAFDYEEVTAQPVQQQFVNLDDLF